jgi:hypothetical protein
MACPIPRAAPVITATLPRRDVSSSIEIADGLSGRDIVTLQVCRRALRVAGAKPRR